MTDRRALHLVLLIGLTASILGLFIGPLRAPDEIRTAEVAREMAVSGDYVVPRLAGELFIEHPPLVYALMAASYRVFGVNDAAARVPSAIAGFLLLLLIHSLAKRIGGARAGILAVLAWLCVRGYYQYGTKGMVDPTLALFVTLGYFGFVLALARLRAAPAGERAGGLFAPVLLIYAAAAMAQLTKGPVGLILIAGPIGAGLLLTRSFALLRTTAHLAGLAVLFLPLAIWVALLRSHGGQEAFELFVFHNFLYRIIPVETYVGGHQHGFLYYFAQLPGMVLPWLVSLPAVLVWVRSLRRTGEGTAGIALFLASVFPVGLALLLIPGTKRPLYLLPLLPALSAATGAFLAMRGQVPAASRLDRVTFVLLGLPVALGLGLLTGLLAVVLSPVVLLAPRASKPGRTSRTLLSRGFGLARDLVGIPAPALAPMIATALVAVTLIGMVVEPRLGEHDWDLTPMATGVIETGLLGPDLATYDFGERDRAVLAFRSRVVVRNLLDPEGVSEFMAARPSGHLLVLRGGRDVALEALRDRFTHVRNWEVGGRTYDLFSFGN